MDHHSLPQRTCRVVGSLAATVLCVGQSAVPHALGRGATAPPGGVGAGAPSRVQTLPRVGVGPNGQVSAPTPPAPHTGVAPAPAPADAMHVIACGMLWPS